MELFRKNFEMLVSPNESCYYYFDQPTTAYRRASFLSFFQNSLLSRICKGAKFGISQNEQFYKISSFIIKIACCFEPFKFVLCNLSAHNAVSNYVNASHVSVYCRTSTVGWIGFTRERGWRGKLLTIALLRNENLSFPRTHDPTNGLARLCVF